MPSRSRRASVAALSTACAALALAGNAGAATVSQTFGHTGGPQSFVVPDGVDALDVVAIGGRGGSGQKAGEPGTGVGGRGARVSGTIDVEPGQRLWVQVGGNGIDVGCAGAYDDPRGAYNGGGRGGGAGGGCSYQAGGGGGASDVRVCAPGQPCDEPGDPLGRLIVAGGGGGGGRFQDQPSGHGGDALVAGQTIVQGQGPAGGGEPGTDLAGGAGGVSSFVAPRTQAGAGVAGQGGTGASAGQQSFAHGGGGGGGRYGGGGGGTTWYYAGGGGGGSNLVPAGGSAALDAGGTPQITIEYEVGPPASIDVPTFGDGVSDLVLLADGEFDTSVTTVVRDADGTPLAGLDVAFAVTGSEVEVGPASDNGDGTYTADVGPASERGTTTITAQLASPELTSPPAQLRHVDRPTVTAPSGGTLVTDTTAGPPRVTVSGTADPLVNAVDVMCLSAFGFDMLGEDVPVTDGTWTVVDAALADADDEGAATRCMLAAVPDGVPLESFFSGDLSGPWLRRFLLDQQDNGAGTVGYAAGIPGTAGDVSLAALGAGCGPRLRQARDLSDESETWLRCGAGIADPDGDAAEAPLTVDGKRALTPAQVDGLLGSVAGQPNVTVTTAVAGDGSFVVTERSPLARCSATDDIPQDASECGALVGVGVTATVRVVVSPSGERAEHEVAFESTDGQQHAVTAALTTRTGFEDTESRLGEETDWTAREPGPVDATPGPYSVLLRDAGGSGPPPPPPPPFAASAYTGTPAIAVTAAAGPQRQHAFGAGVEQRYERIVPADGVARLAHTFELADPADVEATAAAQRAAYDLGVEITSVPSGTTDADTATIAGTAFDNTGEVHLRVGGAPVPVGADGRWSATVPLAVGDNAVEAVVTSAYGGTRSAKTTIARTSEPEPREPEPRQPEPRQPEPRQPEPRQPEPRQPEPRQPEPRQPEPRQPEPRQPPAPGTQPLATLTRAPAHARLAQVRRRGVPITVALSSRRARLSAVLSGPTGRFATAVRTRASKGRLTLRLKPSGAAAGRLARLLRTRRAVVLRLRLTVRADGETTSVTRTIRLTR